MDAWGNPMDVWGVRMARRRRRRSIEFREETGELKLRFGYDADLVEQVRALPQRRFDAEDKSWYVPAEFTTDVLEVLEPWEFEVPDTVSVLAHRGGRNATIRRMRRRVRRDSLSPYEVNARARRALRNDFDGDIWVVGEVSGWRQKRGHAFFELVERHEWNRSNPKARLKVVAFEQERDRIEGMMAKMQPPLAMRDGLEIRVQGRVEIVERTGAFQLRIRELDPYHTISALTQQRERVLEALDDMGISEQNLALEVPEVPLRVGLITSVGSDAYNDVINELKLSGLGFQVLVFDARMQGAKLEHTVLQAMRFFEKNQHRVDVVALVRGGGARSDLSQFDTFEIGKAICELPVPMLCGIGHHMDHCLVDDLVRPFKTPTAVAQALVFQVQSFVQALDTIESTMIPEVQRQLYAHSDTLDVVGRQIAREASLRVSGRDDELRNLTTDLGRWTQARLREGRRALGELSTRVPRAAQRTLDMRRQRLDWFVEGRLDPDRLDRLMARRRNRLEDLQTRLGNAAQRRLGRARQEVSRLPVAQLQRRTERQRREMHELQARLERATTRAIAQQRRDLDHADRQRQALDPERVLERGYALVIDPAQGTVVKDAQRVAPGAPLKVRLAKGQLDVQRIHPQEPTE